MFFSSIVPVRISVEINGPFKNLLSHVAQEVKAAYRHRSYSTEEVNKDLRLRNTGRQQVFDISFSLDRFLGNGKIGEITPIGKRIYNRHEQWPLEICLSDYNETGDASLGFSFNRACFV